MILIVMLIPLIVIIADKILIGKREVILILRRYSVRQYTYIEIRIASIVIAVIR